MDAPTPTGCAKETLCKSPAAQPTHRGGWLAFCVLLFVALGCSAADLVQRQVATPIPTRTLLPTFTPTPESMQGVIIVTPPFNGTPGVIIVPPGTDPKDVIPIPPTPTPTPLSPAAVIALTETAQPTATPTATDTQTPTPTATPND